MVRQLVKQVVGHVETDQTAQLFDVFGQLAEIVSGQVELDEMIEKRPVDRKLLQLIERKIQYLTTVITRSLPLLTT